MVGAGHIGMPIIYHLSEKGHLITVIEKDEKRCKEIAEHSDAAIFNGNGIEIEIWKKIETDKIDAMFILTNDDETNLQVCQIAKSQFGIPFVIARAHQPEIIETLKKAGVDVVICPSQETYRLFLNALETLNSEILYENASEDFKIIKLRIPTNGSIIGKTVDHLGVPEDCRIVGVFRNGQLIYPTKTFMFKGGDKVLISGSLKYVEEIAEKIRHVEAT
ncbi:TrkA family potassium uptake protein [Candidatus Bathyarchaeota archaeon]|nr:TrkA family potassium uptake protein [Candidatus Bathyarchaeota archaeon]MBS7630187.1 TrkA family potassium uptake protein [Candidatus Bathyarchaeota archaeon]